MKLKLLSTTFLFLLMLSTAEAHKKKSKARVREHITYTEGFFSFVHNTIRVVGNVYEISISTNVSNITIDSVWFGATPVPCDVYEPKTLHRVFSPLPKGKYIVKANRNLYSNFYRNIDSTKAYQNFVPPFEFKGDLVIMYSYMGKRYYKTIYNIKERAQKQMRD